MVHEEYADESNNNNFRPKRAPYGYDTQQVYDRERDPTNKEVKLPEVRETSTTSRWVLHHKTKV